MNAAIVSLLVIVGALVAMLGGAVVVVRIMSCWIIDAANRYRLNVLEYAQKIADEKAQKTAPKPDAAKECGVVPPKFDAERRPRNVAPASPGGLDREEQPRRKGRYKVFVYFWWRADAAKFHDLAEFYRYARMRKCDFSPSTKMDEDVRLCHIANRIADFYRLRRMSVRTVKIFRRRWYDWTFPEVKI